MDLQNEKRAVDGRGAGPNVTLQTVRQVHVANLTQGLAKTLKQCPSLETRCVIDTFTVTWTVFIGAPFSYNTTKVVAFSGVQLS